MILLPNVRKWVLMFAFCIAVSRLHAQPAPLFDKTFWMPNGTINAILPVGNTVYIGGDFSYIGPRTGPMGLFDQTSGAALASPPRINGILKAAIPDGAGGWFIGGTFNGIENSAVTNVAHLRPDLSVDISWNAKVVGTVVNALVLDNGRVYVGGQFTRIGGQTLSTLAGLSASNAAITWNPQMSGTVNALQVTNGLVYVGGNFTVVGASNRQNLAAISTSTALANAWDPGADQAVFALQVAGNTVYVGGQFVNINYNTKPRNRLAALDATTGVATTWNPNPNGIVRAIAFATGAVYVGGDFTTVNVSPRRGFAVLNPSTGAALALDLQLQSAGTANLVRSISLAGSSLYVGGQFNGALGVPHIMIVGIDTGTSLPLPTPLATDYNGADGAVFGANALAFASGHGLIVGDFQSVGGVARRSAAALSLATGAPLAWAPGFDNPVLALAYGTNTVFVGGTFTNISSPTKTNLVRSLAAVDPDVGTNNPAFAFLGTNAASAVLVKALAFRSNVLYVGGQFTVVGTQNRRYLAAVDMTGSPTAFNANLLGGFSGISSLALGGTNLYISGDFTTVNGLGIPRLASVSAISGSPNQTWVPTPNQAVNVLTATSDSLYVGGLFNSVVSGGTPIALKNFAGFSLLDNSLLFIDASLPTFAGGVTAIGASPTSVYIGGSYSAIGGENRQNLACIASVATAAFDWNPSPDVPPNTIVLTDNQAFVGGPFHFLGQSPTNLPNGFFAVFSRAPQPAISRAPGKTVQITTTTGDRTDAVIQGSPTLTNPVWTSLATNDTPGTVWTTAFPGTLPVQFFRVIAR